MSARLPCTPASAVVVVDALPLLLRRQMTRRGLSLRGAAREVGVSFSSLHRLLDEQGRDPSLRVAVAVLRWLEDSP